MAQDNSTKPYTFDDLSNAMKNYNDAKGKYDTAQNLVKSSRAAMESHERTAAEALSHVDRYKAEVRRITENLEK
jgi:hypothetical protein